MAPITKYNASIKTCQNAKAKAPKSLEAFALCLATI
jgi:hypothetical protein